MGFLPLMQFFDETRTAVAAQGVGIARGAAERALEYAEEREQFDRPISDFQAIKHKLAEMHTNTEAARWLTYRSAWAVDNESGDLTALASMAKEFASRTAVEVANEAVQVHGGAGYVNDHDVERLYRDEDHPDLRGPRRSRRTSSPANSSTRGYEAGFAETDHSSLYFIATELMQNRLPVGSGPSSNTWPRCESQFAHRTSVRRIPWLVSVVVVTDSSSAA